MSNDKRALTRRRFLAIVAGGASLAILSACGGTVAVSSSPAAPASGSAPASAGSKPSVAPSVSAVGSAAATPAASGAPSGAYPTYAALQGGPKPDFPALGPLYEDGFTYFPANPIKTWNKPAPGSGGAVQVFVGATRPAVATPVDQNPAWQQINKTLNANVQINRPTAADYPTKLATLMAGNDLPDIMVFTGGLNGTNNLAQFLQQAMQDLTPYLAGDNTKNYPNLAALPTFLWKNTGCVYGGKLYMIPVAGATGRLGSTFMINQTDWDADVGKGYVPKNSDDFKRTLQALNKPAAGRYAAGSWIGQAYGLSQYVALFGAPNNWALGSDGKLTKDIETPQYKEAVGYLRDLVASGVYHPDSLSISDNAAGGDQFVAGKFDMIVAGFGGTWQQEWVRGLGLKPPKLIQPLPPFPAHDGQKITTYFGAGATSATGLKKASDARIKELLGILDWLASPFGSQEDLLMSYGAADVDYKLDQDGHPAPTDKSNADAAAVNWKTIVTHPSVANAVGLPEFAKATVDIEHASIPYGLEDPTWGVLSPTNNGKGVTLNKAFTDGVTDILAGRQPLTSFDQLVKDWQSNGGETIRQEYMKAIAAAAG
ncbi:MAG: hypothetical protein JO247_12950 [Chloroflexi bacterium]|nr:hypothetical protein [Chloroflexota bacterium]